MTSTTTKLSAALLAAAATAGLAGCVPTASGPTPVGFDGVQSATIQLEAVGTFVSPEEGQMIWSDNMLIPNLASHQGNAEEWINYYYDPEVAAKLAAYVWYICPVKGAQEAMEKVDPSLVDNQLIFPSAESLKTMHSFMALEEFQIRAYEGDFADVIGG